MGAITQCMLEDMDRNYDRELVQSALQIPEEHRSRWERTTLDFAISCLANGGRLASGQVDALERMVAFHEACLKDD